MKTGNRVRTAGFRRTPNAYGIIGSTAYLVLTNRRRIYVGYTVIDLADLPIVLQHGRWWSNEIQGSVETDRVGFLHRFLMKPSAGYVVEHISGDHRDNRRQNLRVVTRNVINTYRQSPAQSNKGRRRGVVQRGNRWRARVRIDGKVRELGLYRTFDEACAVVENAELSDPFSPMNRPHVQPYFDPIRRAAEIMETAKTAGTRWILCADGSWWVERPDLLDATLRQEAMDIRAFIGLILRGEVA